MSDLRCATLPARVPAVIPASLMGHIATRSAKYVIERDGVRLEFGDDFTEDTLRRVLGVLRSC